MSTDGKSKKRLAKKRQSCRWVYRFLNPGGDERGAAEAPGVGYAALPPPWLLYIRWLVFFQGTTRVQGTIKPFLRVWQPRVGECWAWVYKVWTPNVFRAKILEAGLELTFGPSPGDAHIAGPSQAARGVTDGQHWAEIPKFVFKEAGKPDIVRYEYPSGAYWEVFCTTTTVAFCMCVLLGGGGPGGSRERAHGLQVGAPMRRRQAIPPWHEVLLFSNPVGGESTSATPS